MIVRISLFMSQKKKKKKEKGQNKNFVLVDTLLFFSLVLVEDAL